MITHKTIEVERGKIHIAQAGLPENDPILFLHEWPENWKAFERII